jgi:hypothetical protein
MWFGISLYEIVLILGKELRKKSILLYGIIENELIIVTIFKLKFKSLSFDCFLKNDNYCLFLLNVSLNNKYALKYVAIGLQSFIQYFKNVCAI